MRVISGKWGGRVLVSFNAKSIRPTMDRVKETIFNIIGPDIRDSQVLDLFAGTGSLGIEALSRGASSVIAVDKGLDSKKIIKKNCDLLGIESEHVFQSKDVLNFIKSSKGSFDYILIDPPFTQKMGAKVMKELSQNKAFFKEDTQIFIEYVKGEEIYQDCEVLSLDKTKNYGDKFLCIYSVKEV